MIMRRFLLNLIAPDGADIDIATVSFGKATATKWLLARLAFDNARHSLDDKLLYITIDNNAARFFQGWPIDVSDLVDALSGKGNVEISPDCEADFSIPSEVEPDDSNMKVTENGITWCAFFDNGLVITTAELPWETIQEVANEVEPTNNNGHSLCWWCGAHTKQIPMFTGVVDECPFCRR
jgi:hypothetical protein